MRRAYRAGTWEILKISQMIRPVSGEIPPVPRIERISCRIEEIASKRDSKRKHRRMPCAKEVDGCRRREPFLRRHDHIHHISEPVVHKQRHNCTYWVDVKASLRERACAFVPQIGMGRSLHGAYKEHRASRPVRLHKPVRRLAPLNRRLHLRPGAIARHIRRRRDVERHTDVRADHLLEADDLL